MTTCPARRLNTIAALQANAVAAASKKIGVWSGEWTFLNFLRFRLSSCSLNKLPTTSETTEQNRGLVRRMDIFELFAVLTVITFAK